MSDRKDQYAACKAFPTWRQVIIPILNKNRPITKRPNQYEETCPKERYAFRHESHAPQFLTFKDSIARAAQLRLVTSLQPRLDLQQIAHSTPTSSFKRTLRPTNVSLMLPQGESSLGPYCFDMLDAHKTQSLEMSGSLCSRDAVSRNTSGSPLS